MKKVLEIQGMSCQHCAAKATNALNSIVGVEAKVNLDKQNAVVKFDSDIADQVFIDAVDAVGYKVVSVTEKKGLFR